MPLTNKDKDFFRRVLDRLAEKTPAYTWNVSWISAHDSGTSQNKGFKPFSMKTSDTKAQYRVGIFFTNKKKLIHPAVFTATFDGEPDHPAIIEGLRAALEAA